MFTIVTTDATYLWYITKDVDLISGAVETPGTDFTVSSSYSVYNNTTGGTNEIHITWNPSAIGQTFYLVEKTTATSDANGVDCTVENMKVYEIKPVNTFLLAVVGSDLSGDDTKSEVCVDNVESAIVSGSDVTYLYGTNTIYYKITASGILGGWNPRIQLPALAGAAAGQTYVTADWTDDDGSTWHSFGDVTGGAGNYTSTDDATVTDAVNGSDIIVRLVIDNERYETLSDQGITIGVDGYLPTAYTESDIKGGGDCTPEDPFGKTGTSTITPRPTLEDTTTPSFMPEIH